MCFASSPICGRWARSGQIDLDEARRVLAERLLTIESEPPAYRYGRVFVGTPHQARGRSFRVVFVPGLAERMFPQKPREDPMMLDALREAVERRAAQTAAAARVGAAAAATGRRRRVRSAVCLVSAHRAERIARARAVVLRARRDARGDGPVPDHEELEQQAREAGDATLAWPAPSIPAEAIDNQEHDLAVLRRLLDEPIPRPSRGTHTTC